MFDEIKTIKLSKAWIICGDTMRIVVSHRITALVTALSRKSSLKLLKYSERSNSSSPTFTTSPQNVPPESFPVLQIESLVKVLNDEYSLMLLQP